MDSARPRRRTEAKAGILRSGASARFAGFGGKLDAADRGGGRLRAGFGAEPMSSRDRRPKNQSFSSCALQELDGFSSFSWLYRIGGQKKDSEEPCVAADSVPDAHAYLPLGCVDRTPIIIANC